MLNVRIEVTEDGVYLNIVKKSSDEKIDMQELTDIVTEYEIKDIDYEKLGEIVDSRETYIRKKVTDNVEIKSVGEKAVVEISSDKMKAHILFISPVGEGKTLNKDEILKSIADAGVVFGLNNEMLEKIYDERIFNTKYEIASGKPCVEGKDGYIKYNFNTGKKKLNPVILNDGTADFFNLNLYEETKAGGILAEKVSPVNGENGSDVTGSPIQAKLAKMQGSLPVGQNAQISLDGIYTIAQCLGQIEFIGGKVNILPVLTLKEVGNTTGNIEFTGAVVVEGDVFDGFSIVAGGNVEVKGIVEGATIESGGSIFLYNGIMGREKAVIKADGDITAKFIDSSKISSGGNIYSNSIMHSDIECNKEIILSGKNGLLVGGRACAGEALRAIYVGSTMATYTAIEVGNTPSRLAVYRALEESLQDVVKQIFKMDQAIKALKTSKGELNEQKKNIITKSYHTKIYLISKKTKIEQQLSEVYETLDSDSGEVFVEKMLYSGVKITIGNYIYNAQERIQSCSLKIEGDKIVVGSCF